MGGFPVLSQSGSASPTGLSCPQRAPSTGQPEAPTGTNSSFGSVRKLPCGRFQVRYFHLGRRISVGAVALVDRVLVDASVSRQIVVTPRCRFRLSGIQRFTVTHHRYSSPWHDHDDTVSRTAGSQMRPPSEPPETRNESASRRTPQRPLIKGTPREQALSCPLRHRAPARTATCVQLG